LERRFKQWIFGYLIGRANIIFLDSNENFFDTILFIYILGN